MNKRTVDLILDQLHWDLLYSVPEVHDLRWDIAKKEINNLLVKSGPKKSTVAGISLISGIGLGIYGVRAFPRTKVVKLWKFLQEYFRAQRRLSKILVEESYRIDDALASEEQFLNMMADDLGIEVHMEVSERGDGTKVINHHLNIKKKKKTEG